MRGPEGLTVVPWVVPAARGGPGPWEVCTLSPPTPTPLRDLVPSPEDTAGGEYSRLSSLPAPRAETDHHHINRRLRNMGDTDIKQGQRMRVWMAGVRDAFLVRASWE